MPTEKTKKLKRTGPVALVPLRNPDKVYRIVRSLRRLVDRYREDLLPSDFWTEGTYFPASKYNNAYLFILRPTNRGDLVALSRSAARLLETSHNQKLDWAAGIRKSGSVWLIVKARGYRADDYKMVRFYPTSEDLRALRSLVGTGRHRAHVPIRKKVQVRER